MRTRSLLFVSLLLCCACGGEPRWSGRYASTASWNLGGPLANGRTVGDSVTDLLVEQTVSLTGVPSLLEEKAQQALDALLRAPVKSVVDPLAPPELQPGGQVYEALALSLAQVRVESALELKAGRLPRSLGGVETFGAFEYTYAGTPYRLDAAALGAQGAPIVADWDGKESAADVLDVEPHAVELKFGELVQRIADRAVDAARQTELKNAIVAALTCDQVVARVVNGGPGVTITVADWSHTLSTQQLRDACNGAGPIIRERVVGLVKVDSKVELGGAVTFEGPGTLRSNDGFGGLVYVAPKALAPRVGVAFTAARQK